MSLPPPGTTPLDLPLRTFVGQVEMLCESLADLAIKGLALDLPSAEAACEWLNLEGEPLLDWLWIGDLSTGPALYRKLKQIGSLLEAELLEYGTG